jgi:putative transcriptional regulator
MSSTPNHHPAEDTLLRHAAGTLAAGRSLVVATHLWFCPDCRAAVRFGEAIGGAFLADMPAVDLPESALNRVLARLDTPVTLAQPVREAVDVGLELPEPLHGLARSGWRWLAPGIRRIALDVPGTGSREYLYLLRVAPGQSLPDHGHRGWEATCVLSGSFSDATGEYGPGDLAEMTEDAIHQPVSGSKEACVCLIASEGRLRMRGLLARALQPLIGV